jgi:ATP-dependent Lon protease
MRLIEDALGNYTRITGKVMPHAQEMSAGEACDVIAASLPISIERKQEVLAQIEVLARLETLYRVILKESEIAEAS